MSETRSHEEDPQKLDDLARNLRLDVLDMTNTCRFRAPLQLFLRCGDPDRIVLWWRPQIPTR